MKQSSLRPALFVIAAAALAWQGYFKEKLHFAEVPKEVSIQVLPAVGLCFTPGEECTQKIVDKINLAKKSIKIQAYSFTSAPIAQALLEAKNRLVDVQIILDSGQESEKYSSLSFFKNSGLSVYLDNKHAIAHNKIMIIDDELIITGSFNFTKSAQERNAENLVFLKDTNLAKAYEENWQLHKEHSESVVVPN